MDFSLNTDTEADAGIRDIDFNEQMQSAWEFAENTDVSIFLTGKAGTGKTTFLRYLKKYSAKTIMVVAPTGVAAMNAHGQTIHSLFQIAPVIYTPGSQMQENNKFAMNKQKLRMVRALDLLVIDEISMVRADLLDAVDAALKRFRKDARPFGGVQLLMIGDLQQLAPVTTPEEDAILKAYYPTPYFFGSRALSQISYVTITLTKVYRQQNPGFLDLLNHVRDNRLTPADEAALNSRVNRNFCPPQGSDYIRLTTHNRMADDYNARQLQSLPGHGVRFEARVKGVYPESTFPTAQTLELKEGAQVMFLRNDANAGYYNGLIGHVVEVSPTKVMVKVPKISEPLSVVPIEWENPKYVVNPKTNTIETEVQGTFTQLPLRLAWAVTIHKSQGLTFDHVIIDAANAFAPGQVYVALSRCKTLEGIVLGAPLHNALLGADPEVERYISFQDEATEQSLNSLSALKEAYARKMIIELFTFVDILNTHQQLHRQLNTVFRHMFPQVCSAHLRVADTLRDRVVTVADNWIRIIATMPYKELTNPHFVARISNAAEYFMNEFKEAFGDVLRGTSSVRSENKRATQRVQELLLELSQRLRARLTLLNMVATEGFSTVKYLTFKEQAWLMATSDAKAARKQAALEERAKRQNAFAEKSVTYKTKKPSASDGPKPKKESNDLATLRLFREGFSREEIAQKVGFTVSTITRHLMKHVETGELNLTDILTPVRINAIVSVLNSVGGIKAGYEAITKALPEGISYDDVRLVAAVLMPAKNEK